VSVLRVGWDVERMGSLACHVAEVAGRRSPGAAVPGDIVPLIRKMGAVAARLADGAAHALADSDATTAARLDVDDDAMDGLHRAVFAALLGDWPHPVTTAVDVALLARYYERFADHAVAVAGSVVYAEGQNSGLRM
jgi:phosphate transport system protein